MRAASRATRGSRVSAALSVFCVLGVVAFAAAQSAPQPLAILDVPYVSQSEALCGGAAAAMVLRYWGERGLTAESFAHLVGRSAAGIRTDALVAELRARGWNAVPARGDRELLALEIERGRPVVALIEDRPGTFHYVVVVAAHARAVVVHDPARAPFQVMALGEFGRRWEAADRWMAVITPGERYAGGSEPAAAPAVAGAGSPGCERLIAEGVRQAQAGELEAAERTLASAFSCPGGAAFRELAGVRLLQRRWREVTGLASAALAENPDDAHAWRLLATARYVQNDVRGALAAWNAVGEPRLDLIRVDGLGRTRHRTVERLVSAHPGDMITADSLTRSTRRLRELPSAASTRLELRPVASGLAELRAAVLERPLWPADRWAYAAVALSAAARREVAVSSASPTGGGERLTLTWRFWEERPLYGLRLSAPAPWGGIWTVEGFLERQPFDGDRIAPARRLSARLTVSDWDSGAIRWSLRGGVDRWRGLGVFGAGGVGVLAATADDRVRLEASLEAWKGPALVASGRVEGAWLSSSAREGFVVLARGGAGGLSSRAPADLWFGGDTGVARPMPLRAHPVLSSGALRLDQLGRQVIFGSLEAQRWWVARGGLRLGAAAFADTVHVGRGVEEGYRRDVDAGIGLRIAIPGLPGSVRLDAARGLRDGAAALSLVYEP